MEVQLPLVPTSVSETLASRAGDLAALALDALAVRVLELDGEVVVALAELGAPVDLLAAHAVSPDRVCAEGPVGHVQVMHVLLDDMVAAEPGVVVPVAHLVLHVGPLGLRA